MRRIGRAARTFALVLLAVGSTLARSDEQPRPSPQAVDPVDRILAEWQAKSEAISSVDVRFRLTTQDSGWGQEQFEGRAVLAAPNRAYLEESAVKAEGKPAGLLDRWVWDGRTMLYLDPKNHSALRFTFSRPWPSRPGPLCLPFFYRMTVAGARQDYDWQMIRELPDRVLLKARTKKQSGSFDPQTDYFIELDRKTFLPNRLIARQVGWKDDRIYEALAIKVNAVDHLDELMAPCLDAWEIQDAGDWLTRRIFR